MYEHDYLLKVLALFLSELESGRTGGLCYSKQIRHCWLSLLTIAARVLDNIPDLCHIELWFLNSDPVTTIATQRLLGLYQEASNHIGPLTIRWSPPQSEAHVYWSCRSVLSFTTAWMSHRCQSSDTPAVSLGQWFEDLPGPHKALWASLTENNWETWGERVRERWLCCWLCWFSTVF